MGREWIIELPAKKKSTTEARRRGENKKNKTRFLTASVGSGKVHKSKRRPRPPLVNRSWLNLANFFQRFLINVKIGIDVLDIVCIFQRLQQPDH